VFPDSLKAKIKDIIAEKKQIQKLRKEKTIYF